jgi:hypothetical protein
MIKVDTSNFNKAMSELSRLSGVSFREVIRSEVAAVIAQTIKNTKKADKALITKVVMSAKTSKGKSRLIKGEDGVVYNMNALHSGKEKIKALAAQKARLKELIARVGLAKQSWLEIATKLNLNLPTKAPGYVNSAKVKGKTISHPVSGQELPSGKKFSIVITNADKVMIKAFGKGAFLKAIGGRAGYFYRNQKKGVFKKVDDIAKKYRGLKVLGV